METELEKLYSIKGGEDAHSILKRVRRILNVPEGHSITDWSEKTMGDIERAKDIISKFALWQLWSPDTL